MTKTCDPCDCECRSCYGPDRTDCKSCKIKDNYLSKDDCDNSNYI
jgi:hypothetical protein